METFGILPHEVAYQIMSLMNLEDLFIFSMVNKESYMLAANDRLWGGAFKRDLPKIYLSFNQFPIPEYWKLSDFGSRLVAYQIMKEKNQNVHLPEEVVVMNVLKNCNSRLVFLYGCFIIRRLTYAPPDCSEQYQLEVAQNRNTLGENDVVDLLLGLVKDTAADEALMAAAICAINNIASDHNCQQILNQGGINLILNSIDRYPEDVPVLDYSASAIANIIREINGMLIALTCQFSPTYTIEFS
eukprot:TRINITY_DN8010_c0_g1_i2.p1 TRINITY_DN8010_c0_g1~~TRINITY_DN8010_c0_g1_i2.p1  ORF type:complete len:254 (-),score=25.54 TRINITY_DN8010_c0_g1_i2:66-794(-)